MGFLMDGLVHLGDWAQEMNMAVRLGSSLCMVDRAVFPHRPATVGFLHLRSDTIATYHSCSDEYFINVRGLRRSLKSLLAEVKLAFSDEGVRTSGRIGLQTVLSGIAVHEVRHRLQYYLGDDLRMWKRASTVPVDHVRARRVIAKSFPKKILGKPDERDALFVEYAFYLRSATSSAALDTADLVWFEPQP